MRPHFLKPLNLEQLESRDVPTVIYGLTNANQLVRFDSAAPTQASAPIAITGLGANQQVVGIDFRPRTGQLIGSAVTDGSANNSVIFTYRINPLTGTATLIGQTAAALAGAGDVVTGYDFNPTVDRIRYVNGNDENARMNPNTGALAGNDTDLTYTLPAAQPIIGAAYDRNTDRQSQPGTIPTTLFGISRGSNSLVRIGGIDGTPNPNQGIVNNVGPLGVVLGLASDGGFDIVESINGTNTAYAALRVGATNGLYTINLSTGAATFVGSIGPGTTDFYGIAAVPEGVLVVGSGTGAQGDVRLLDPTTGAVRAALVPFAGFQGGVRVGAGDVNGDGVADAIVTAVAPQGHVKVFDGVTGAEIRSFFAFENFLGTVNVSSGDVNGDGFADILVSADGVLGGHVKAFNGLTGAEIASFFAYENFLGNVSVSAADFDNNGRDEIVTAAAIDGHVKVFNGLTGAEFSSPSLPNFDNSFFAFPGFLSGNVYVAAGDVDGDGRADIVVSSGGGSRGHVKTFSGVNGAELGSFFAYDADFTGGAFVGLADSNGDGLLDIRVTPGVGLQSNVSSFSLAGSPLGSFSAFAGFAGGATIAGARF